MAFWGVEVKPDKPYKHPSGEPSGRLRLSQATLGFGASMKKCLVQCNVGNKRPVLLCSLMPDKSEYCHLELEFDEEDEVVFSIIGPRSVHLSGYYLSTNRRHRGFDDSSESYGEDIGHSDTDKCNDCTDDDDYEGSFINDDNVEVSQTSPGNSDEMEDEMMDAEEYNGTKERPCRRRLRKFHISESEDDLSEKGVANGDDAGKLLESEDEDRIPISSVIGCGGTIQQLKLAKDEVGNQTEKLIDGKADKSNRNIGSPEADPKREPVKHTSVPSDTFEDLKRNEVELKAGKKKSKRRERKDNTIHSDSLADSTICKDKVQVDHTNENQQEPANDKKSDVPFQQSVERKSKNKKRKAKENENVASMTMETKEPRVARIMTLSNGLVVKELEMGEPNGEVASSGRKVKIHYTGMLKEGGNVYESTVGSNPIKFRLGKGRVIEGVELGVEGMHVGGRRRLMIPPELGYGRKGVRDSVPPNSWLTLDVELLSVR